MKKLSYYAFRSPFDHHDVRLHRPSNFLASIVVFHATSYPSTGEKSLISRCFHKVNILLEIIDGSFSTKLQEKALSCEASSDLTTEDHQSITDQTAQRNKRSSKKEFYLSLLNALCRSLVSLSCEDLRVAGSPLDV
jgi:hypothetical protein